MLTITDRQARMIEIAENLHRNDLTELERRLQTKEWLDLKKTDLAIENDGFSQTGKNLGGRPGLVLAAANELGINATEADRAEKIGSMASEVITTAKEIGLDDNRSALELAARKPLSEQADTLRAIKEAGSVVAFKSAADPASGAQALEKQVAKLMTAWNAAGPDARQEFLLRIDQPIMDRRYG